ncbi:MAG: hypothetical protein M3328_14585 [Chloroflexota bacterium]|nr:hypothetical protein [Chloroflexota bacterium]
MDDINSSLKVLDGLLKDPDSGDYRVLPGYSQQVLRYAIHETWLDEGDGYWIAGSAVERELRLEEQQLGIMHS